MISVTGVQLGAEGIPQKRTLSFSPSAVAMDTTSRAANAVPISEPVLFCVWAHASPMLAAAAQR